jgi:hypothetical protein
MALIRISRDGPSLNRNAATEKRKDESNFIGAHFVAAYLLVIPA